MTYGIKNHAPVPPLSATTVPKQRSVRRKLVPRGTFVKLFSQHVIRLRARMGIIGHLVLLTFEHIQWTYRRRDALLFLDALDNSCVLEFQLTGLQGATA